MHWIDWAILIVPLIGVLWISVKTQRYMRSVSDFMAAGRGAGRYLVATAGMMAGWGLISAVAEFELIYKAGLAFDWWRVLQTPATLFLALTGFVLYRYRETRVLTLAQLFEARYSKAFRIFSGFLASVSGIINYAIFPSVGGRFLIYYCKLPLTVPIFGFEFSTFALVMIMFLSLALVLVMLGGQLTIMVTDCVQGLFSYAMYIIIAIAVLSLVSWSQMAQSLTQTPPGESLMNPFDTSQVKDFNIWFVLIGIFGAVYGTLAWQGSQGFNASAANPHEAKMGGILGRWRDFALRVMLILLAISAYTYMHHPDFAAGAAQVNHELSQIDNPQIQEQMRVPVALSHLLPIGIKGIFLAVMVFLLITTDVSYLHSWGSIIIQDMVLPLRKKPLTTRQHLWLLRLSIAGVAVFAFFFSLLFRQTQYIYMFFALTGSIYLGGAGAVIIGGLYWKKGTTAAAWVSMILGGFLGVAGVILEQIWAGRLYPLLIHWFPSSEYLKAHADSFPINGQYMWLIAMVSAIVAYIVISLLTCKEDYDMDKLLHRGKYAIKDDDVALKSGRVSMWQKLLGIDHQFTLGDKVLSISVFVWTMLWVVVFAVVTAWNFIWPLSTDWWTSYWYIVAILMPLVLGVITSIWFTVGGIIDLKRLFVHLRTTARDVLDDGTVAPTRQYQMSAAEISAMEKGDDKS
ncbi:MAG: hypothetical protein IT447_01505 [Phycisphaerales bacterium]|jgi:SSS family solute:Na+ symporter|nr:hypothetical protein [Phycisphaerales bacterium]